MSLYIYIFHYKYYDNEHTDDYSDKIVTSTNLFLQKIGKCGEINILSLV